VNIPCRWRVRPRGPADGRLIDLDDLVHQFDAFDGVVDARLGTGAIDGLRQRAVQDVVDERGLAGAAHAGDRREGANREPDVDVLQVVRAGAADADLAAAGGAPRGRRQDRALSAQVGAGERVGRAGQHLGGTALEDHSSAVFPGAGSKVHYVVGGADRLLVVLHHDHGVAQIPQARQRRQQLPVVALVQADGRLVQHVQHAAEVRADLRGQPDPLALAARQRGGAAVQGQVTHANVVQEVQPLPDLPQYSARDEPFAVGEFERVEHVHGLRHRQPT
jgi:hypothetical protein